MVKIVRPIQKEKSISEEFLFAQHLQIESLAWETGYYKRSPKKITATHLFLSFWLMCNIGKNDLTSWVIKLGLFTNMVVSEQSLNERLSTPLLALSKAVIKEALELKLNKEEIKKSKAKHEKLLTPFNNILIRDSTTQQINSCFNKEYPGSYSHTTPTAIIRIQALYNFTTEQWVNFDLTAYTDNDQKAAPTIAKHLQKKDLLLQDLGYFSLDWLKEVTQNQYVITKWDNRSCLYHTNGNKIDLLKLLKGKRRVDINVLVGSEKRVPLRLVVKKLPNQIAKKRIEKARNNRNSKANHSQQYFKLLQYEIYLTNVEPEILDTNQVVKLYGLRWHIEILFKSWKSFDYFRTMLKTKKLKIERIRFMVYAILIKLIWIKNIIYHQIKDKAKDSKPFSELCFISTANVLLNTILKMIHFEQLDILIPLFKKHAVYYKHNKRQNTKDRFLYVNELCIIK